MIQVSHDLLVLFVWISFFYNTIFGGTLLLKQSVIAFTILLIEVKFKRADSELESFSVGESLLFSVFITLSLTRSYRNPIRNTEIPSVNWCHAWKINIRPGLHTSTDNRESMGVSG